MHDPLRQRLMRLIESLPDAQIYQVLDYIEFLESKYAVAEKVEASGLQKFAEGLEDRLRKKAVSPATIREAFQLISAADRVLSGVSNAGKKIISDLGTAIEGVGEGAPAERPDGRDPAASELGRPGAGTPPGQRADPRTGRDTDLDADRSAGGGVDGSAQRGGGGSGDAPPGAGPGARGDARGTAPGGGHDGGADPA